MALFTGIAGCYHCFCDEGVIRIKEGMMEFIVSLLIGLIVFDVVAMRWGFDSRDSVDSPEWERRQRWYGFH